MERQPACCMKELHLLRKQETMWVGVGFPFNLLISEVSLFLLPKSFRSSLLLINQFWGHRNLGKARQRKLVNEPLLLQAQIVMSSFARNLGCY